MLLLPLTPLSTHLHTSCPSTIFLKLFSEVLYIVLKKKLKVKNDWVPSLPIYFFRTSFI